METIFTKPGKIKFTVSVDLSSDKLFLRAVINELYVY
jgi:hypothetical protein